VRLEDGLGWEQICPFLGHKIPEVRYPRGNDPKEFSKEIEKYLRQGLLPLAATAAAVVVPLMAIASWQTQA
jgi:hypothetical protein